ncbi:hypothetical protein CPB84DRAFT_904076 [Gymnopilus junonius]|uniref:Uncharacterized protein n=1 Tax=Gymnopilus junonius TaxID=109634 RepID=A0A9P5N719_GYMJU|nr:hypothetical protein CPB84DRAFT_904076 [Gymnopilus junonius]
MRVSAHRVRTKGPSEFQIAQTFEGSRYGNRNKDQALYRRTSVCYFSDHLIDCKLVWIVMVTLTNNNRAGLLAAHFGLGCCARYHICHLSFIVTASRPGLIIFLALLRCRWTTHNMDPLDSHFYVSVPALQLPIVALLIIINHLQRSLSTTKWSSSYMKEAGSSLG